MKAEEHMPQIRECGNCNLCCKLPEVKNVKGVYEWCKNCEIGVGCKTYNDRPKICKDFVCAWAVGLTPSLLSLPKVGFYIVVESLDAAKEKVITVWAETHKVNNIIKYMKDRNWSLGFWRSLIRYNKDQTKVAEFTSENKLNFYTREMPNG
jgi:hypothetical protein